MIKKNVVAYTNFVCCLNNFITDPFLLKFHFNFIVYKQFRKPFTIAQTSIFTNWQAFLPLLDYKRWISFFKTKLFFKSKWLLCTPIQGNHLLNTLRIWSCIFRYPILVLTFGGMIDNRKLSKCLSAVCGTVSP